MSQPNSPAAAEAAQDVRTRILQAALALLADQGVSELTQPKVARAAGVRQSHLTYYFPTRADLMLAVAAHSIEALTTGMASAARAGALTRETLPAALAAALSDKRRARMMLGLVVTLEGDAKLREGFRELVASLRARLGVLLAQLGLPADADTLAVCHSAMVGAAMLHLARDDATARQELHAVTQAIVERLLAVPPAKAGEAGVCARGKGGKG